MRGVRPRYDRGEEEGIAFRKIERRVTVPFKPPPTNKLAGTLSLPRGTFLNE